MKLDKVELSNIRLPNMVEERSFNGRPYVYYGENNLFPQELIFFSDKSVTHAACLELIKTSIGGEGFTTTPEATSFLESQDFEVSNTTLLEKISSSMAIFNGYALEVIWNKKGDKIVKINILPFENIRCGIPDRYGKVSSYFYNSDWDKNSTLYEEIMAFDPLKSKEFPKQLLYMSFNNPNSLCYPIPKYVSSINYIACEYELGKHHLSSAVNSFLPSAMITFIGNPTDDERILNKRMFERTFVGAEATSKVILNYVDSLEQKAIIDQFSANGVVDQYINTSIECRNNIITSNGILSPALLAIADGNQSIFSNGEELKTVWDIFYRTKIRSYQILVEKGMNIVLKYSGFPDSNYKITPYSPVTIESQQNNIPQ